MVGFFFSHSIIAEESSEPVEIESVTVVAHFDYCDFEVFQQRMNRFYEVIVGQLQMPKSASQNDVRCLGRTCPYPYMLIGKSGVRVTVDNAKKEIVLLGGWQSIEKTEKETVSDAHADLIFVDEHPEEKDWKWLRYAVEKTVKFNEVFNAEHKKFNLVCPPENCTIVDFESAQGPLFYTETRQADGSTKKRLIVNSNVESTFSGSGAETEFKKCTSDAK